MLNLNDPTHDLRARFREVWQIFHEEGEQSAKAFLNELLHDRDHAGVQAWDEPSDRVSDSLSTEQLQSILMEERRRWEDARQIASLVIDKMTEVYQSSQRELSEASTRTRVEDTSSSVKFPTPPLRDESYSSSSNAPSHARKPASVEGLDLAGMIDGMLRDERGA